MPNPEKHDLIVIGAGPAGLTAALKGESEGIDTLVLDSGFQVGGQAAESSCIENYAGFPKISGPDLMARIVDHALKYNAEFKGPTRVTGITETDEGINVLTDEGNEYLADMALLCTGVEFKSLNARNMAAYVGSRGVHYGPAPSFADYSGKKVFVIGGANSAGQAAVKFAEFDACEVSLLVRGDDIEKNMSTYLINQISERDNIEILTQTEVLGVDGNGHLSTAEIKTVGEEPREVPVDEIFVFIGSIPKTLWLPSGVLRDKKGFIVAGSDLPENIRQEFIVKSEGRPPYGHETSMPGLFVACDVRCGTPKGVSVASGDGAGAVAELHNYRHL
jgi:thioredoxin reductase (NADPH)